MRRQFGQRIASGERQHIGLGGVINCHTRAGQKARDQNRRSEGRRGGGSGCSENRSDSSVSARILTVIHVELIGSVALDCPAEQSEARIVDDVFDLDACGGQRLGNPVAGIRLGVRS